jgi:3-methyladenine DNA glycosylase AlkD
LEFAQRFLKKATPDDLGIIELMITEKSWWDTVDLLATHCAGSLFRNHPELISSVTEEWMNSGNMWLQRTCLLFQLKYKKDTDLELLTDFIERLNGGKEFFINKAIGWVLREYSKTDADWTIRFIESHELAGLSEREGLKWLRNKGVIEG